MRILHLSTRLILGGSQENTVLSCEGQLARGHEVHLAYGPIYGPEGSMRGRVEEFASPDGRKIQTHELPNLVRELSPLKDWQAYRECRALIRRIQPEVVHTHSSKAGIIGRAAAWAEGGQQGQRAVIHTIHGLPFHPYEKRWRNAVYILSERYAAKRCQRIVTVCDAMREQALAEGIGKRKQFTTVYSGMEVERFIAPARSRLVMRSLLGLNEDDFVIGTVARLAELKGHDDLIAALAERMNREPKWKMLWVGDGWWRERLVSRLRAHGLSDQVVLTGLVAAEEVGDYLAALDVLVHPSYREGLPRTVPQALLGGVPVVVYDVDGAPEVCLPGETGLLVKPGDLAGLGAAVAWMADHPAERLEMGRVGRDQCRVRFAATKMVDELEQVYCTLLADGVK